MEMKTTIKLNQPEELPATGLTTVQFKPWKNHVVTFLMQDPDNQEFLPGGMYEEWLATSDNPDKTGERISLVQVKEEDLKMNEGPLTPFLGNSRSTTPRRRTSTMTCSPRRRKSRRS